MISAIFWVFNALSNDYSTVVDYPIAIQYNKNKFYLQDLNTKKIPIRITGYGWNIIAINAGLYINPIIITPDKLNNQLFIYKKDLELVAQKYITQLKVDEVIIDSLSFNIERIITKNIVVNIDSQSVILPRKVKLNNVILEPSEVSVTGPKSILINLPDKIKLTIPEIKSYEVFESDIILPVNISKNCKISSKSVHVKLFFN
ncbi:MAG: hypothetical protein SFY32_17190 [Bacteroidota bacterium]|nr:hypothetical protein [Bacteroidota bacterium]